jgi:hypothetical protein
LALIFSLLGLPPLIGEGNDPAWFELAPSGHHGEVSVRIDFQEGAEVQGWSFSLCHEPAEVGLLDFGLSEELNTVNFGMAPEFCVCEEGVMPEDGGAPSLQGIVQAVVLSFHYPMVLPAAEEGFPVLEAAYEVLEESVVAVCDGLRGSGQPIVSTLTVDGSSCQSELPALTLTPKPYAEKLQYRVDPPESGEVVTVKLFTEEVAVQGWSFALGHLGEAAQVVEVATSPEVETLLSGDPPQFVDVRVETVQPYEVVRQSVVLGDTTNPVGAGPFPEPDGLPLLGVRYRVAQEATLKFVDHVGEIPFDNRVTVEGLGYVPQTRLGARLVLGSLAAEFIRGDANLNSGIEITDSIFILRWLFLGGDRPPCLDAADANDIGLVDLSDSVWILRYLFLGGPPPPSPFPDPGEDLSPQTALGCERGL